MIVRHILSRKLYRHLITQITWIKYWNFKLEKLYIVQVIYSGNALIMIHLISYENLCSCQNWLKDFSTVNPDPIIWLTFKKLLEKWWVENQTLLFHINREDLSKWRLMISIIGDILSCSKKSFHEWFSYRMRTIFQFFS